MGNLNRDSKGRFASSGSGHVAEHTKMATKPVATGHGIFVDISNPRAAMGAAGWGGINPDTKKRTGGPPSWVSKVRAQDG